LLGALNVSGLGSLADLYCYGNNITNLNVAGCTNLVYLGCEDNNLSTLDVSGLSRLAQLNCYGNFGLTNLNVTGCTNLIKLNFSYTGISGLDVSTCTSLTNVVCGGYITDLASFVTNAAAGGLGAGDSVSFPLLNNSLTEYAKTNQIPELTKRQVSVSYY
jgi:Leucine-rich repeat (LRR) protein